MCISLDVSKLSNADIDKWLAELNKAKECRKIEREIDDMVNRQLELNNEIASIEESIENLKEDLDYAKHERDNLHYHIERLKEEKENL